MKITKNGDGSFTLNCNEVLIKEIHNVFLIASEHAKQKRGLYHSLAMNMKSALGMWGVKV